MDATTRKLCEMLTTGDPELQVAAARVLGELGPADPNVLATLGAELRSEFAPARIYALRALARSSSPAAVAQLVAALDGPPELRTEAVHAIVGFGRAAATHLKHALTQGSPAQRKGAASALARIGGKQPHQLLLRALAEGDLDLAKHICFELDGAIPQMNARARTALAALVHAYLGRKRIRGNATALASGIILLGMLGVPASRPVLLKFIQPTFPGDVRRRALRALQPIASELTQANLKTIVGCLADNDLANVVFPAIKLLSPLDLPTSEAAVVAEMVGSTHKAIRDFAIAKLGELSTPKAARILIGQLHAPQPARRDLALQALRRNAAAPPLLLKRLKAEEAPSRLWALARALEPHADQISTAQARTLTRRLLDHLENGDPRAESLSFLLRHVASEKLDAALLKRAADLKAAARYAEAARILDTITAHGNPTSQAVYQSAIVGLKLSPKSIGRNERHADPCLRRFENLLADPEFSLLDALRAEACLEPHDLFYIGFHFAEQLGGRRTFGGEVLQHIEHAGGRSAVATHARNKLRLEGFPLQDPKTGKTATARRKPSPTAGRRPPKTAKPTRKRS